MLYLITGIILVLDQWIKLLIRNNFQVNQSLPVIKNIFHLTYIRNIGAGFGILAGYRYLFIMISLVTIGGLLVYRYRLNARSPFLDTSVGLIIGGATGNIADRLRLGYVVDYLDFRIWPVFNLADSAVVIGVGLLILYIWKVEDIS